ncbi:unnamed protein product [Ceutorhynchus assimilis]|uniref:Tetratricopeptide repeat protein 18 n=1 Tax=Ceutorhynchus assimilis TaxID=467358 RepID=A0A9N9MIW9_9CUCU|nr:unnamed protein product [Ceutorhynchus assimilis]
MSKKTHKTKKYSKSYGTSSQDTDFETATGTQDSERHITEGRTIVIKLNSLRNIVPLYRISDVKVQLKYLDKHLGETRPMPVVDNELPLNDSFELLIDLESTKQLDLLASNPVFITVLQLTGTQDPSKYEYLQISAQGAKATSAEIDSLFRLYEAFNGERPPVQLCELKKRKKAGKRDRTENGNRQERSKSRSKSITSRDSKSSKKSKTKTKSESKSRSELLEVQTEIYGMCVIDLIPLFYGETSFSETLLIQPVKQSCQILSTHKNFPEISITVAIKDNAKFINILNVLNLTVESICNVPSMMLAEMDCTVCAMLPLFNSNASPTIFQNPKITTTEPASDLEPKRWPGLHDIGHNANTTKYFIEHNFEEITNRFNLNIRGAFKEGAARIEYNYLKRNILYEHGNSNFAAHVQSYRKLALEIYLTQKTKKHKSFDRPSDDFDEFAPGRSRKSIKIPARIHLMAILDLVDLLYPGVTKLHIVAPVTYFHYEEAAKAGLNDSYFLPKPIGNVVTTKSSKTKLEGNKKNKKNAEKKDKNVIDRKDKLSVTKDDKDLAILLPAKPDEPLPPEPCRQVHNDNGEACFIIIELELLNPLNKKLDIEEIETDFHTLQLEASQSSKTILNQAVADEHYNRTIKEIKDDIYKHWQEYNNVITSIPMPNPKIQFPNYLKKLGAYQLYGNSIITSATLLITNNYKCFECDFRNNRNYQNLISEVYTGLTDKMYGILNVSNDKKAKEEKYSTAWNISSYFYAKEAAELKLDELGKRYFVERIIVNDNPEETSQSWFDFAIYNIEIDNVDKAFECVKEATALNSNNKHALLLLAILLADKDIIQDAEICFLNLLDLQSGWVEGWCILYLFYQKCSRLDGMEMVLDIVKKFANERNSDSDYFEAFEDLAWSWKNIPKTFFLNAAVLLLKMRLYSWAELALAEELLVPKHYGYVNYLLAVVSYYKKNFEHALEHVKEAKVSVGSDYTILALSGHILLAQSKENEAKDEYFRIIESYNKPKDIHLVYLNSAEILAKQGEGQTARKCILNTCKIHQTPHVWLTAGKLFYQQNDLLSAEECFNKTTMKDNRYPEAWGYLTLVNLKLNRIQEAEQCYEKALKNKLMADGSLNQLIVIKLNEARSL